MTLKDARINFTALIALLIQRMAERGLRPALSEGMDRKTEKDPTSDHMKGSLHEIGLAQDIELYDGNGAWLKDTSDHKEFGEFWESLDPFCKWGGRFSDGNHYSYSDKSIPGCTAPNGLLRK